MTTAAAQQHQPHPSLAAGIYDTDEPIPHDSPLMKALHPKLELSPSPPPDIPLAQVSSIPPPTDGLSNSNRPKILSHSGNAVLVASLDNGRRPEIARAERSCLLTGPDPRPVSGSGSGPDTDTCTGTGAGTTDGELYPTIAGPSPRVGNRDRDHDNDGEDDLENGFEAEDGGGGDTPDRGSSFALPASESSLDDRGADESVRPHATMTTPNLQHLAAGALHAVTIGSPRSLPVNNTPDISVSTRQLSIRDDRPASAAYSCHSPQDGPRLGGRLKAGPRSRSTVSTSAAGELPPLQMDSPKTESNGQSLPSIRSTLGDINHLPSEPPTPSADKDTPVRHGPVSNFPRSPPLGSILRLSSMPGSHVSPPISPQEVYQRGLPSPHSLTATSPYYYPANGLHHRPSTEYSSGALGETPSTEPSVSTPATSTSVADRMSIDGITNPQVGVYVCNFSGCTAAPFQTQYLLNSHANVHSSARPHYCPVQGCSRSEGGKGFKRKNEMIRHGLVHDSPGYVCPFCPEREHKYPRPDNLQRHVRVHHIDKDKDDPMLREVLAQRPDGPNRGRRRRGLPA